jgi:hypothetical protein
MAYRGTVYRLGTSQTANYTSVAASISNAFAVGTQVVRLSSTTGCHIRFGSAPTAVATDAIARSTSRVNNRCAGHESGNSGKQRKGSKPVGPRPKGLVRSTRARWRKPCALKS